MVFLGDCVICHPVSFGLSHSYRRFHSLTVPGRMSKSWPFFRRYDHFPRVLLLVFVLINLSFSKVYNAKCSTIIQRFPMLYRGGSGCSKCANASSFLVVCCACWLPQQALFFLCHSIVPYRHTCPFLGMMPHFWNITYVISTLRTYGLSPTALLEGHSQMLV